MHIYIQPFPHHKPLSHNPDITSYPNPRPTKQKETKPTRSVTPLFLSKSSLTNLLVSSLDPASGIRRQSRRIRL
ncbi:hypothetical protein BofuT4_P160580.1 [Botrytis cinerea T4]|uniref:Uncharacterized protein n=1 Tax=Botryotinia fuckeliana (strain T4) TaxID=999810 RepID=G2YTK9_BOTF4|nr:hypothetical protein BofuT4_P160580.1 [Botrytis cinerea T4]